MNTELLIVGIISTAIALAVAIPLALSTGKRRTREALAAMAKIHAEHLASLTPRPPEPGSFWAHTRSLVKQARRDASRLRSDNFGVLAGRIELLCNALDLAEPVE